MEENMHSNTWSDKEVEQHWDRVAPIYIEENLKVKKAHEQRFTESVKHLSLFRNARVLNITSRDCEANDYIIREEPTAMVTNAEISGGLMDEARKIRPYARQVKLENYSRLPFDDGVFDRILSLETLEHVADPIRFLSELNRISARGALMVLSCPPATSEIPYQLFTRLFGGHGEGPHRFLKSREVKQIMQKTGWKLKMHKGTVLIPVGPAFIQDFGEWIIRNMQGTFIAELGIRQFFVCEKN